MDPVVHFEMPYEDKQRMADFYCKTFGWVPKMLGPDMNDYVVVATSETDSTTMSPRKPGMINGGFYKKSADAPVPSVVIAVDDIKASMEKVKAAGGQIVGLPPSGEPYMIPGTGLYVAIIDSEGNRVSMLQPLPMN